MNQSDCMTTGAPGPSTWMMAGAGVLLLGRLGRRRRLS
ncbi:MYXO-CTERM sorting domain-containing protein [Roseateles sp. P5_E7]